MNQKYSKWLQLYIFKKLVSNDALLGSIADDIPNVVYESIYDSKLNYKRIVKGSETYKCKFVRPLTKTAGRLVSYNIHVLGAIMARYIDQEVDEVMNAVNKEVHGIAFAVKEHVEGLKSDDALYEEADWFAHEYWREAVDEAQDVVKAEIDEARSLPYAEVIVPLLEDLHEDCEDINFKYYVKYQLGIEASGDANNIELTRACPDDIVDFIKSNYASDVNLRLAMPEIVSSVALTELERLWWYTKSPWQMEALERKGLEMVMESAGTWDV